MVYLIVCLCVYILQGIILTSFWLGWLFVFASIKSNSFMLKAMFLFPKNMNL